jgi:D-3-phosphoglycerate dehydrogenase / 2-oxoglutarate reductase
VSLAPLPVQAIAANLPDGLDWAVTAPVERTTAAAAMAMPGADLVLGDYSGEIEVDASVVAAMDRVRLFHQPSTGFDNVDVEACAERGIPVTNAGRATSVALGEHTVMVTLALLKSLVWCDRRVRAGAWPQHDAVRRSLVDLQGKTVGLVGFGGAAEEAARRFAPFGCRVLYTARRRRPAAVEEGFDVEWAELDKLLAESDVVCLLADLNPTTRNLIDADALATMKQGAFLVNAARGGVVDEEGLVAALRGGHLKGAALDVFATEPLPTDSPLRDLDTLILTPHVGGATLETRRRILQRITDVFAKAAAREMPDGCVNGVTALRLVD